MSQVSTFRVHFLDVQTRKARFSRLGTVAGFLGLLSRSSVGQNLTAFPQQTVPPSSTRGKHTESRTGPAVAQNTSTASGSRGTK